MYQVWWTLAYKPLRTRRHKSRRTLCQRRSARACVHSVGMLCGYMPISSCFYVNIFLHCALSLAAQCIVIGPVCGFVSLCVCGCVCCVCVFVALNFWVKSSVMSTVHDSLTRQQFSVIMSRLLQSLRISCCFTLFSSVRIGVLNYPLFAFNSCLSVIDCREIILNSCRWCCANSKIVQLLVML